MSKRIIEISVVYLRERFRNDQFSISIARLSHKNSGTVPDDVRPEFSILGEFPPDAMESPLEYRLYGKWERDRTYGWQFRFQTFVLASPHEQAGVVKYLQRCADIGPVRARKLWERFKGDAVRVLREQPDVASAAVPDINTDVARRASDTLNQWRALEDCTIEVTSLLDGMGLPKKTAQEAIQSWGNRAPNVIRQNPYRLMRFRGCGFALCDKLYCRLGLPLDRLRRQMYAAAYAVAQDRHGHTWLPLSTAVAGIRKKISANSARVDRAIELARRSGTLAFRTDDFGREWVADARKARHERIVAERVALAMTEPSPWGLTADDLLAVKDADGKPFIDEDQIEAALAATSGAIGLLIGSPGVGKTRVVVAIIRALIAKYGLGSVAVATPTGKAAVRVNEVLDEHRVPIVAKTWHRTLVVENFDDGGGWRFKHNENDPLPHRFIVGDETSMDSVDLKSSQLRARSNGTGMLFVGDVDQLPPVGHGAPLRDMIAAGVPCGRLTQIRRNAGTIVRSCKAIREQKPWQADDVIDPDAQPPKNLKLLPSPSGQKSVSAIIDVIRKLRDQKLCDPVWDVQVICAVNKKSPLGRHTLNEVLRKELNPNGQGHERSPFRSGDKVMVTRNQFFPALDPYSEYASDDGKILICNGEFGEVITAAEKYTDVRFFSPDREVRIPRGSQKQTVGGNQQDDDDTDTGCDLVLGYAATCHKYQGSEVPIAIVALDSYPGATGPYGVCCRNWLYTAMSRAKLFCLLVGMMSTARNMCSKESITLRKTFLAEDIAAECRSLGHTIRQAILETLGGDVEHVQEAAV